MLFHEIISDRVKRNHGAIVLEFLRERIGKPRKSGHVHPHREVTALNVAGRDMGLIGIADPHCTLRADVLDRHPRFQTQTLPGFDGGPVYRQAGQNDAVPIILPTQQ
jgi:hypothetical protein